MSDACRLQDDAQRGAVTDPYMGANITTEGVNSASRLLEALQARSAPMGEGDAMPALPLLPMISLTTGLPTD